MSERRAERAQMVRAQIAARGIRDPRVLDALLAVPREDYVDDEQAPLAYEDGPLPIAKQQTISQPYIVALMSEALELSGDEKVLEIGTGSGYAAAILGELAREVHTIERHGELAQRAARRLAAAGYRHVHVHTGDGTLGLPAEAPFDAVVVTAAGPELPPALLAQLANGGRLVMPVGRDRGAQELVRVRRISEETFQRDGLGDVRFVPLVGAQGWPDDDA